MVVIRDVRNYASEKFSLRAGLLHSAEAGQQCGAGGLLALHGEVKDTLELVGVYGGGIRKWEGR